MPKLLNLSNRELSRKQWSEDLVNVFNRNIPIGTEVSVVVTEGQGVTCTFETITTSEAYVVCLTRAFATKKIQPHVEVACSSDSYPLWQSEQTT